MDDLTSIDSAKIRAEMITPNAIEAGVLKFYPEKGRIVFEDFGKFISWLLFFAVIGIIAILTACLWLLVAWLS